MDDPNKTMPPRRPHDMHNIFPAGCLIPSALKQIDVDVEDIQLVTCRTDKDEREEVEKKSIRNLSENEIEIVSFWFGKIKKSFSGGKLVFRGQNQKSLINQLDKEYKTLEDDSDKKYHINHYLYHRLFFFGEKARWFYSENGPHDLLRPETDCCKLLFQGIQEKLLQKKDKLPSFIEQNPDLISFFNNNDNINHFCVALCKEEKLYWYYSILLHRLGKTDFLPSYYVSNSKNILVSNKFSHHSEDSIIILYVVPDNQPGKIYSALDINNNWKSMCEFIERNGLPPLSSWPYSNQNETTIPGCMFPHYLWFVFEQSTKRIIINPHIFTDANKNNKILRIEIDQSDFDERLRRETGYVNGIFYDDFSGQHEII